MNPVSREQAEQAAKRILKISGGPEEVIAAGADELSYPHCTVLMASYILQSTPTVEKCREFVEKCREWRDGYDPGTGYRHSEDELTAELMTIGVASDEGEAVTFDEVKAAIDAAFDGKHDGIVYRANGGKLVVLGLGLPADTRGQLNRILAALGIGTQPTGPN